MLTAFTTTTITTTNNIRQKTTLKLHSKRQQSNKPSQSDEDFFSKKQTMIKFPKNVRKQHNDAQYTPLNSMPDDETLEPSERI